MCQCIYLVFLSIVFGVNRAIGLMVECSSMVLETGVQSKVESYQRLKKIVLDAALLNTQHYKVWIKGKVEQSREWSSALPDTLL